MADVLWIATLQYRDRQERFGVSESALEMFAEELTKPWLYLPYESGLVFVKTDGLEWLSIAPEAKGA